MFSRKDIFVVIGTLISIFVILEFGFRILGYRQSIYAIDPSTGLTVLRPNSQFYWQKECYKNLVRVNSFGFHDKEFLSFKPSNTYRIAVIGDSYVEALQVPLEKTFHKLLEKKLNENRLIEKTIEVYSFGHSGNGTLLNLQYLKKVADKFKPDLIINCFLIGNDFRDDSCNLTDIYVKQTGDDVVYTKPCAILDEDNGIKIHLSKKNVSSLEKNFLLTLASKSSFLVWLYERIQILKYKFKQRSLYLVDNETLLKESKKSVDISNVPVDFQVFLREYNQIWKEAWLLEEYLLREMQEYCKERNIKLLVVSLTEGFRVHKELQDTGLFEWKKPERLLYEISEGLGFSYLPLIDVFRKRYSQTKQMTTFDCDGHWNEVGHEWAADAIFEYLMGHRELLVN